jgi:hypothetical protein
MCVTPHTTQASKTCGKKCQKALFHRTILDFATETSLATIPAIPTAILIQIHKSLILDVSGEQHSFHEFRYLEFHPTLRRIEVERGIRGPESPQ